MPRESMHLMPVSQAAAPEASFSSSCTHCSAATSHTGLVSALQRERGPGASRSWFNPEESTQQKASLESQAAVPSLQLIWRLAGSILPSSCACQASASNAFFPGVPQGVDLGQQGSGSPLAGSSCMRPCRLPQPPHGGWLIHTGLRGGCISHLDCLTSSRCHVPLTGLPCVTCRGSGPASLGTRTKLWGGPLGCLRAS